MGISKKIGYCILAFCFSYMVIVKNYVISFMLPKEITIYEYTPLYYIAIIIATAVVVGISILILILIYKSNQIDIDKRGEEK